MPPFAIVIVIVAVLAAACGLTAPARDATKPARIFPAQLDADGDHIPDVRDACPAEPEDLDGYLDDDGCPDVDYDCHPVDPERDDGSCNDRDRDGVPNDVDRCPDRPGSRSREGCPACPACPAHA